MKKIYVFVLMVFSSIILVSACSGEGGSSSDSNKENIANEKGVTTAAENKKEAEDSQTDTNNERKVQSTIQQQPNRPVYTMLNGKKFEVNSPVLQPGDIVTDLTMYEKARVTGDLVIVVSSELQFRDALEEQYTIRKIAELTYRLTPIKTENLFINYKTLKQLKEVKTVEIQLDYSPVDDRATY